MRIHILGIGGTFMAGIASLAKELGYEVSGSDQKIYPPMSTQLEALQIQVIEGFDPDTLKKLPNNTTFLIGNALSRNNPCVEYLLNEKIPLFSAPFWLHQTLLKNQWVLAVAGTHGKTTTTSMLTWILECANYNPGFLIGGMPSQFNTSARLGGGEFFVIEADEYDTSFFDKRSKFVHYWPKTCILNNLEFDHADIFDTLADIQKQFHHLVRLVPQNGLIIYPHNDENVQQMIHRGCWTPIETIGEGGAWHTQILAQDGSVFEVYYQGKSQGVVEWDLIGLHNINNALVSLAAANHVGVDRQIALQALKSFVLPKRRLEHKGTFNTIEIYDDFAHHPSAIASTLKALRAKMPYKRIGVLLDIRSNSMRLGIHQSTLLASLQDADLIGVYFTPDTKWDVANVLEQRKELKTFQEESALLQWFKQNVKPLDQWIIMSNGSFNKIFAELVNIIHDQSAIFTI